MREVTGVREGKGYEVGKGFIGWKGCNWGLYF